MGPELSHWDLFSGTSLWASLAWPLTRSCCCPQDTSAPPHALSTGPHSPSEGVVSGSGSLTPLTPAPCHPPEWTTTPTRDWAVGTADGLHASHPAPPPRPLTPLTSLQQVFIEQRLCVVVGSWGLEWRTRPCTSRSCVECAMGLGHLAWVGRLEGQHVPLPTRGSVLTGDPLQPDLTLPSLVPWSRGLRPAHLHRTPHAAGLPALSATTTPPRCPGSALGEQGMSVTVCVGVTCWVIRAAWKRHGPQGSPGPALERTRRVPEGQPGLVCHRHSCVTLGIKWGSGVALLVLEVGGGGLRAPRGPAHWPHTQAKKWGTHPGAGGGWAALPPSTHLPLHLRMVPPAQTSCTLD